MVALARVMGLPKQQQACAACGAKQLSTKDVVLREGDRTTMHLCQRCGHGILDEDIQRQPDYYQSTYRKEHSVNLEASSPQEESLVAYEELNRRQFAQLKKVLSRGTRYLEIGCSFGGVIRHVKPRVRECHAVEPNVQDAEFTSRVFGARVINASLEEVRLPEGYFDVIAAFEVLEHVDHLETFLGTARRALRHQGVLHLEVPNLRDALLSVYRNTGYSKFFYHKAHRHYFTAESLLRCTRKAGFRGTVSSFQMYSFFNHVNWHFQHAPQQKGTEALTVPAPCPEGHRAGRKINEFYQRVNRAYDELVSRLGVGDCLVYQGRRS